MERGTTKTVKKVRRRYWKRVCGQLKGVADYNPGRRTGNNSNIFRIFASVKAGVFTDENGRKVEQVRLLLDPSIARSLN